MGGAFKKQDNVADDSRRHLMDEIEKLKRHVNRMNLQFNKSI
jgi:hypothetical protein